MLLPNWSQFLTGSAKPAAYSLPNTKKIAVLMTDGEYNSTFGLTGIESDEGGGYDNNATSSAQAVSCAAK
jgi:hypothetical protein